MGKVTSIEKARKARLRQLQDKAKLEAEAARLLKEACSYGLHGAGSKGAKAAMAKRAKLLERLRRM